MTTWMKMKKKTRAASCNVWSCYTLGRPATIYPAHWLCLSISRSTPVSSSIYIWLSLIRQPLWFLHSGIPFPSCTCMFIDSSLWLRVEIYCVLRLVSERLRQANEICIIYAIRKRLTCCDAHLPQWRAEKYNVIEDCLKAESNWRISHTLATIQAR